MQFIANLPFTTGLNMGFTYGIVQRKAAVFFFFHYSSQNLIPRQSMLGIRQGISQQNLDQHCIEEGKISPNFKCTSIFFHDCKYTSGKCESGSV